MSEGRSQYERQQEIEAHRAAESTDKPGVFIPLFAIRCTEDDQNKTKFGNVGYYNGVRVYRFTCNGHLCKWVYHADGTRTRIVTFHYVDQNTGERVANERRPHNGQGR